MPDTITAAEYLAMKRKPRSKYGVSPPEQRTWRGKVYASKAECQYAQQLALDPTVAEVVEQPRVRLGEDHLFVPDFLVIDRCGNSPLLMAHYVDVKGFETRQFSKARKLWAKYGRLPLWVVKRGKVEIVPPRGGQEEA